MQHRDIAQMLREALVHSGCSDQQIGNFDGHSTIELELEGLPSIKVGVIEDDVWLWSTLVEWSHSMMAHCSESLLSFLMQGCPFSRTEQMQLVGADNMLEVRVMLSEQALSSPEALAGAIDAYLKSIETLCDLVRQ
jgi:hypothetical protein